MVIPEALVPNSLDLNKLTNEIASVLPEKFISLRRDYNEGITVYSTTSLTQPEEDAVTATVVSHDPTPDAPSFEVLRKLKLIEIDLKTMEVIERGHIWSGEIFSLSQSALITTIGMFNGRMNLVYPVRMNTKDDSAVVSLTNALDVESFYYNALITVRTARDSGTSLKDQVRAATTVEELTVIVDTR